MKALFVLFITVCSVGFAQENPWKNKETENPWATESAKETSKVDSPITDSTTANDISDTTGAVTSAADRKALYRDAETTSREHYKSGGDFVLGFTSGLVFNVLGIIPDMVYTIPTTKKEKIAVEKTVSDSTYTSLDDEKLTKKTKSAVKSKKFLATLGGTVVGSLTQIGVLIGIAVLY